ncbi:MAG: hypothetical protein IK093_19650 [Ruminiclostridium sp.]|nr:hypothetical protein [Ruminiclostridium sp.]
MKRKHSDTNTPLIVTAVAGAVAAAALITAGVMFSSRSGVPVDTEAPEQTTAPAAAVSGTAHTTMRATLVLSDSDEPETVVTEDTTAVTGTETVTEPPETTSDTTTTAETTAETTAGTTTASETTATSGTTAAAETTASETAAPAVTAETTTVTTAAQIAGSYDREYFSNDLFIGDSIYTGLYLYEYFPKSQVFAKVGLNPQSARTAAIDGVTAAGKAGSMKPTRIFIMLGSNGLAYMSASLMSDNMSGLVGELKAASPESSIYVVSIPPVTYEHELAGQETMSMVNKYNGALAEMCGGADAKYLDLCGQLMNENGYFSSKYAEADGLHFLGAAYKQMLCFFLQATQ